MDSAHQNRLRTWARVSLVLLLLSVVWQFIQIFQTQYELQTPFIGQSTVLMMIRPLISIAFITTIISIPALIIYFYEKYLLVIILAVFGLIGPHFYPYFLY